MRWLSSSPLTGSDAVSSRFAARYRRYAAASSSATVAMASLVMGSDSIIRSALRRACRLETNGCGCRDQRSGIPSWLPAEPTPTTVSALRPARCLVYWSLDAPVIDTPRGSKMCNLWRPDINAVGPATELPFHVRSRVGHHRCRPSGRKSVPERRAMVTLTWAVHRSDQHPLRGVRGHRHGRGDARVPAPHARGERSTVSGPYPFLFTWVPGHNR